MPRDWTMCIVARAIGDDMASKLAIDTTKCGAAHASRAICSMRHYGLVPRISRRMQVPRDWTRCVVARAIGDARIICSSHGLKLAMIEV